MSLALTQPPVGEPVSLADAKAHLRVDHDAEDGLIGHLIAAARAHLEESLGRAMITQGWTWWLDAWPQGYAVPLPIAPVQSIEVVRLYGADDTASVLPPTAYLLDGLGSPPRLLRRGANAWPSPGRPVNGIEIAFTAGHGSLAGEVPAALRIATLLLVAHWYEHREPTEAAAPGELPEMVADLIQPYRMRRL